MIWVEPGRDPKWDIAASIRHSFRRNIKILAGEYPKPYSVFFSQWQIPKYEAGAPGMARCAEAIRKGEVADALKPDGTREALFSKANIPNHGVLGRMGAAGYLRRVASELALRGLKPDAVMAAAANMQTLSDLFRELRYESDTISGGKLLARIADHELKALAAMQDAWNEVREITNTAVQRSAAIAAE